eukprot:CAMPEP_0177765878 /NCGR_PEP_ID=MMETSP0491_2-20121128/8221_1 /TAXON_ID=63592 /ORGANISM="Tetraselmis chuii, Strain PLY429" /LENGTH=372 /DNA_ID=CAMNT_0019282245 /DNA_START=121 /DNA_END=1240 /DNA_ORIENTATION=+
MLAAATGPGPCDCGLGFAVLSMPIGRGVPRWCNSCPNKPWNAIRRCECNRKKARFGFPGQDASNALWCADCPSRPPGAVNVVDVAPSPVALQAAQEVEADRTCMCGKGKATLALPIQPKGARWCTECPDRPRNAIPVAGRCVCGRRKATLGAESDGPRGAKWCEFCPSKPDWAISVVDKSVEGAEKSTALASQAAAERRSTPPTVCACGKTTASLALPIQLWLAKWCPDCPQKPRNVVDIAARCECGRRKASLGLPGEGLKWCAVCPNKPEAAAPKETAKKQGEENGSPAGTPREAVCVCGKAVATLALQFLQIKGGSGARTARTYQEMQSQSLRAASVEPLRHSWDCRKILQRDSAVPHGAETALENLMKR